MPLSGSDLTKALISHVNFVAWFKFSLPELPTCGLLFMRSLLNEFVLLLSKFKSSIRFWGLVQCCGNRQVVLAVNLLHRTRA